MKKYYKLFIIPCTVIIICLYFLGFNIIKNTDYVDSPKETAAMLCVSEEIPEDMQGVAEELKAADGKVNINTATVGQLMTLDGIGESYANAIIKKREEIGGFKAPEDLLLVKGIGESRLNKIINDITVE